VKTSKKSCAENYILAPHAVFLSAQDGSARVLDLNGQFYTLSAIGADILSSVLMSELDFSVGKIAGIYGVDSFKVRQDASNLIQKFRRQGVILNRSGKFWHSIWNMIALLISAPLLLAIRLLIWHRPCRIWLLLLLSRASFFMFGWERTVQVWNSCLRLRKNKKINDVGRILEDIDVLVRQTASNHPFQMQCKERSLCCWVMTRIVGIRTRLVVGIQIFPLEGHCWCEYDNEILTDARTRCDNYSVLRTYQ